ncbi:hypothetical protein NHQ30_007411 [Ciborinia camelliae]|nr:hypothetical protein NHQ30_007411 [Ciborinia camelliae]
MFKYVSQLAVFPPPVSLNIACLPFVRSQVAKGANTESILFVTHSALDPELSESRYLCTSKTKFVVVPSRLVIVDRAAALPLDMKVAADAY